MTDIVYFLVVCVHDHRFFLFFHIIIALYLILSDFSRSVEDSSLVFNISA